MTETPTPPAGQSPGDEMRALLVAGGRFTGYLGTQAAVHLLTFTDLPDWRGFSGLVEVGEVDDLARGETYVAARVKSWPALLDVPHTSGSLRRLLSLAISMATGAPVDLRENLAGYGHAHMRRVVEAVAIATGATEFFTVGFEPTPEHAQMLAFHAQLDGETR